MKKRKNKGRRRLHLILIFIIIILAILNFVYYYYHEKINSENKNNLNEKYDMMNGNLGSLGIFEITRNLYYAYAPSDSHVGANILIKCDFHMESLPCIIAKHGNDNCKFLRFDSTVAVFNCSVKNPGIIKNYCNLFVDENDSRCLTPQINQIKSTDVALAPGSNVSNDSNASNLTDNSNCTEGNCSESSSLNDSTDINLNITNSSNTGNLSESNESNQTNNSNISDTWSCNETDNGINFIVSGTAADSSGVIEKDSCVDDYTLSEKFCSNNAIATQTKVCPNGCRNGACIVNPNEARTRKNTLIFAGIYSSISYPDKLKSYEDKLSANINGLAGCCNFQSGAKSKSIVEDYHSKGYLVMTHIGTKEDGIQAARDGIDIIIFDEVKQSSGKNGRPRAFSGSEFNNIKAQIKKINPKAKVGIVEGFEYYYHSWHSEGANPDIIGLEQYINQDGKYIGSYPSYDEFKNHVMNEFPNAKTQVWIDSPVQIEQFIGKVYSIVLFAVDGYKMGWKTSYNWPEFRLESCENELKAQYGNATLVSSAVPNSAYIGNSFELKCDFGARLSCIAAQHGYSSCEFLRFEGTAEVFKCRADKFGNINNSCNLFPLRGDSRCFAKMDQIKSIKVKACDADCDGKVCGDNGCGHNCGSCRKNQNCAKGECVKKSCNDFEYVLHWLRLKTC
jgi:hypothetical protein